MCRRFGFLHSRVLLYRQDELYQLEKRLIALDEADADEFPLRLRSRQVDNEQDEEQIRKMLIGEIDEKLKDYGMMRSTIKLEFLLTNCPRRSCAKNQNIYVDEDCVDAELQ